MADLTDKQLSALRPVPGIDRAATTIDPHALNAFLDEVVRHRAAQAASAKRAKTVVFEQIKRYLEIDCSRDERGWIALRADSFGRIAGNIAARCAEQLATPVVPAIADDVTTLESISQLVDIAARETPLEWVPDKERALIARLLAAHGAKP